MAENNSTSECYGSELLHPWLLSSEQLLIILKQRYISQPDLENLNKESLLELYSKYVLPQPQRKFTSNRRGNIMTRKQIQLSKKRKPSPEVKEVPSKKKAGSESGPRLLSSFDDPSKGKDRLKPPPSSIDFKRKTIKLNAAKIEASAISSMPNKRKLNLPSSSSTSTLSSSSSSSPSKKKFTPITYGSSLEVKPDVKKVNQHLHQGHISKKVVEEDSNKTTCSKNNYVSKDSKQDLPDPAPKKKIKLTRLVPS